MTTDYHIKYFADHPQARHGYSRDHRPDCKQVCIGLVATQDGFPWGYEAAT